MEVMKKIGIPKDNFFTPTAGNIERSITNNQKPITPPSTQITKKNFKTPRNVFEPQHHHPRTASGKKLSTTLKAP